MAKSLSWQHVGPAREIAAEVPPISIGNYSYALAYDPKRGVTVYAHAADYHKHATYTWNGEAWTKSKGTAPKVDDETHSFYDASRGDVAVWTVGEDHADDLDRATPTGMVVTDKGATKIKTTGEPPLIEPDSEESFFLSSEVACAMAYDAGRDVTVCLTRRGVWELDKAGAWTKVRDGKGIPEEWSNDASGAYDPIGKRCVLFIQGTANKYAYVCFGWDGKDLEKIAMKGLPNLCTGLFDPCALFASHPKHGVICHVGGDRGTYALGSGTWKKLPDADNPPPIMTGLTNCRRPHMTYDATRDALVIGPGYYEQDRGGGEAQRVFWTRRGSDAWQRAGAVSFPSPIAELYGRHHAIANNSWYATSKGGLDTMVWQDDGWHELVADKAGEKLLGNERNGGLAGTPDGLVAVTQKGSVFRFEGKAWKKLAKASSTFKERSDFALVHDGTQLVAWGGDVKNRKSNDTLFFDGKAWKAAKTSSPVPKDWKDKNNYPEFNLIYDTTLGRIVRFGWTEVATLEGEVWSTVKPKGYAVGARWYEHLPVHDPKTGETLIVDFEAKKILRFDLGGCTEVATFTYPRDIVAIRERESESVPYYFYEDCVFDPATRAIHSQKDDDRWARSKLDLGPVFDAATKLAARKLLGAAPRPAKSGPVVLYKVTKGKLETSAKPKQGFVPARDLDAKALEAIGTRPSSELTLVSKKPTKPATSRLGGLPSGISLASWPKADGVPLGFLFQLVTGDRLAKHAGVAVFCTTDGTATEDESNNRAVLLTKADLAKPPIAAPPEGVPVLEERAIVIEAPLPELDEDVVTKLAARDPDLAAAFEKYQATAKVQDVQCASKLGGAPVWVQGEGGSPTSFIAQLDFDPVSLKKWKDAGLFGVIYIFESKKGAEAMWQYT